MGNFGLGEMVIVLILVLLLFGAKRLPELAGSMGKGVSQFRRGLQETRDETAAVLNAPADQPAISPGMQGAGAGVAGVGGAGFAGASGQGQPVGAGQAAGEGRAPRRLLE